ncbi:TPA: helix-turn-helix domain-containing protein [Bacillus anthracis]|nr:helix-turn-helix transcriptional regulator [Bacillus cereus biovar anthracis]HDR6237728.1 helix-turn-helix transcriptional regulator [Bacillus cereus biovar anthracis]HDR6248888.1 helix-turn-helix transcriptional regulator [Bacillus cereus biovar anthracis]
MNIIGERIFELRKEKKLTQEKIGENIGVSKQTVSKYEKGTKIPSRENIEKLADFFNVPTDFLLGKSDSTIKISNNIKEIFESDELHWDGRKLSPDEIESVKALLEVAIQRMLKQEKKD